jgi:hypothetical protein
MMVLWTCWYKAGAAQHGDSCGSSWQVSMCWCGQASCSQVMVMAGCLVVAAGEGWQAWN